MKENTGPEPLDGDSLESVAAVEEYLELYELYLMGVTEEEPKMPSGLSSDDRQYLEDVKEYVDFKAENNLWKDEDASEMYKTLLDIQSLPEVDWDSE